MRRIKRRVNCWECIHFHEVCAERAKDGIGYCSRLKKKLLETRVLCDRFSMNEVYEEEER